MVSAIGRKPGQTVSVASAYDAAVFILDQWPDQGGPKLETAKHILLQCLAGVCSAAVARVAFVEAAREAGIFVEPKPRPPAGKPPRWSRRKPMGRA